MPITALFTGIQVTGWEHLVAPICIGDFQDRTLRHLAATLLAAGYPSGLVLDMTDQLFAHEVERRGRRFLDLEERGFTPSNIALLLRRDDRMTHERYDRAVARYWRRQHASIAAEGWGMQLETLRAIIGALNNERAPTPAVHLWSEQVLTTHYPDREPVLIVLQPTRPRMFEHQLARHALLERRLARTLVALTPRSSLYDWAVCWRDRPRPGSPSYYGDEETLYLASLHATWEHGLPAHLDLPFAQHKSTDRRPFRYAIPSFDDRISHAMSVPTTAEALLQAVPDDLGHKSGSN